jgi:hypothetical protein
VGGGFQFPHDQLIASEGWTWVHGEGPVPLVNGSPAYANWFVNEPNDWLGPGTEQYMAIWGNAGFGNTIGSWNDEGGLWDISGYVVEYETAVGVPESSSASTLLASTILGLAWFERRCLRRVQST